jgi:hypothetical protein
VVFIDGLNKITNKPWAVLILLIGFAMLVSCKKWGIDTTIAGGVIGVASNMLTSKPEPPDLPPGSHVSTAQQTTVQVPPDPKA